ncbi:WYL domain-containing protein [Microvirga aerilata]|uniref:WYL domain-containing protein n=1 Tax=Microvirga aerilata TaxID=670292 RepID=A0A936ZH46_9HYPH|nr:WYL domain-containing protein [Microvirga aerilata]MBL0404453.1 WYL domain-containing protein [Microvirga aerilata]
MTLDEMAVSVGVTRRTVERMRDALRVLFPQLEELSDGRMVRFRIQGGLHGFMHVPTADELAELESAIRSLDKSGGAPRAALLRSLSDKIRSALRGPVRRRIEPDLEALTHAEEIVVPAGPRPLADAQTLSQLRAAVKSLRICHFRYAARPDAPGRLRRVVPYGILFGKAYYLVGPEVDKPDPVLWRLDRISDVEVGDATEGAPEGFDLTEFASRSFGAFQEPPEEIILRFDPAAAADARRFLFHPSQTIKAEEDGSIVIRFTAGGLLELVRHLFSWGDSVTIQAPSRLQDLMVAELQRALVRHRTERSSERA